MKEKILACLGSAIFLLATIGNGSASLFGWYEPEE